jgi:hypothetical protein
MKTELMKAIAGRSGLVIAGLLIVGSLPVEVLADTPNMYWDADNSTVVRQGYHIEWQRSAEVGANGEFIVSWSDTRFGMRDLFAQKVDASNPDSPTSWSSDEADALIVNDEIIRQEDPVLITDGSGGAIISWIDFRNDLAGDIYVNRIIDGEDGDGELAWGESGILLCDDCSNGSENMSKTQCIDGNNGAWIAWADRRGSNWDLYISHVDAEGNIDPVFEDNGLPVVVEVGDQRTVTMEHDGAGGAFIAWLDKRDAANDDIYIEHVLANGTMVNGSNGQPVVTVAGAQQSPKITWDGGTGCYVAWVDKRNDNAGDIYVQHYASDLTPSLADDGVAIAETVNNEEKNPRLSYAGDGATLLMWEDNRNDPSNTQADVYVQKMTVGDLAIWGAGGVPATLADGNQEQARVSGDGNGGAFVIWQDNRHATYSAIYAQKMDENGAVLWAADGAIVVDNIDEEASAIAPSLRLDGEGGLFAAWGDQSRGSIGIFTQHLNSDGIRSFDDGGNDTVWGISGSCSNTQNIKTDDGVLVFWIDPRFAGGPHVFVQKLDAETGVAAFEHNGKAIDTAIEGGQMNYKAIPDGEGGAYIVIEAGSDGAQQAWLSRVDADGNQVWDASRPVSAGFDSESGLEYQEHVNIVKGQDKVYISWSGVDTDYSFWMGEVFMQAFDFSGTAYWGDDGLRITASEAIHEELDDLVIDGLGNCYVFWGSGPWNDNSVLVQKIDADGNLEWNAEGIAFAEGVGLQEEASAIGRVDGGVVGVWRDYASEGTESDLIIRAMDADANDVWSPPTTVVDDRPNSQKTPVILDDGHGGAFVVYTDFSNTEDDDIYQRHILADGSLLWEDADGEVFVASGTQEDVAAVAIPRGSARGLVIAASVEEAENDTTGYTDIWMHDSHIVADQNAIDELKYEGMVFNFFHRQREPFLSYDGADGVYASWVDMRASGKEDIKDIYATRVATGNVSVNPQENVETRGFQLAQNYPNPFNPQTQISFQLLRADNVNLSVYNMNGQLISELINGRMNAGTHEISFDANTISSGIYVYTLRANGEEQSKRMLLLK